MAGRPSPTSVKPPRRQPNRQHKPRLHPSSTQIFDISTCHVHGIVIKLQSCNFSRDGSASQTLAIGNTLGNKFIIYLVLVRLLTNQPMSETVPAPSALNRRDVTRDIFSASIGSVACCYTGQPFDTVKVRMQTNPTAFPGVMSTTRSILSNEVRIIFS
jgi:hypothetical protein